MPTLFLGLKWWKKKMDTLKLILIQQLVAPNINSCNEPIDFFYLLYSKQLWNLIVTNTNKYARDQNLLQWKDVNVKTMKGFMAIIFSMGLIKKKWNKWLVVSQKLYEHSVVSISDDLWPIQKNSSCISYC